MELIRQLLTSKKFVAMLCGVIGLVILKVFKVNPDPLFIAEIVGLIVSYILGQGWSDNGKGAAQVNAITTIATAPLILSEQTKAVEEIKKV